jgi:ribosome recycling factor
MRTASLAARLNVRPTSTGFPIRVATARVAQGRRKRLVRAAPSHQAHGPFKGALAALGWSFCRRAAHA